jgi:hypothetical protein
MTESKLVGVFLIAGSLAWIWWFILPEIMKGLEATQQRPPVWLATGWVVIGVVCSLYGIWIGHSVPVQAQVSSTNQSGGITAHTVNIDKFITVAPMAKLQMKLGDIIQNNKKTEEGYETVIPLTILSPYPVGGLTVVARGETVKRVGLLLMRTGGIMGYETGTQKDGSPYARVSNVSGTLRLIIVSSQPLGPKNTVTIDPQIE